MGGYLMSTNISYAFVSNHQALLETLKATDRAIALFYASWCPFCISFLPIFMKHAGKDGRNFFIVQDDQETIADLYSVKIYPTVIYFENAVISKRLDGVAGVGLDEKQMAEFVRLCPLS
jgi:thioredoxin 1